MPPAKRWAQRAAIERRRQAVQARPDRNVLASISPSWAQSRQGEVNLSDLRLAHQASLRHPACRWWWGDRADGTTSGAYCYLCDDFISTWHRAYPMPDRARLEVLAHRDQAHGLAADSQGSDAPATHAGADHQKEAPS